MATTSVITAHLMGGLGNQLFQIFTTIAYALEHKVAFRFPYSEMLTTGKARPTYWDTVFKSIRAFAAPDLPLAAIPRISEHGFPYSKLPALAMAGKAAALYGYFQSPLYFEQQFEKICRLLRIEEQRAAVRTEAAELLGSGETVSLHFRLGDYKALPTYHPIMPLTYYKKALSQLSTDKPYRVLYFCEAEDNAAVATTVAGLSAEFPTMTFVKVPDTICDWKQMFLMSLCDHNIIANSSFSWWGAFFGGSEAKRVFYPATWFGPAGPQDVKDLFPSGWTRVTF